jgi:predicted RNA-binding Zn-ribbon protein involved in translation (DUF1610 family)
MYIFEPKKKHLMMSNYIPPTGFIQVESKIKGITVFAPKQEIDKTPEAVQFKCPQCGATTSFTPSARGISCANCGYAQRNAPKAVGKAAEEREFTLDTLAISDRGWGSKRTELHCESCGADISISANALSSTCPFCLSNRVIARVATANLLRPRYLIPFILDSHECQTQVKKWLGKGWMHPSGLSQVTASTQFRGLYLPFWTFDATIIANWRAEVGYERTKRYYDNNSKSWKTRVYIDWRWESGQLIQNPDDWLGIGTTKISRVLLKRLYPFELGALIAYEPDFLAGWQAHNYNIPLQDAWDIVKTEMRERTREGCHFQIKSSHVRNFSMRADFENETWRYILLPVFTAAYRFGGETYQLLVNGQTGKVAGQKPIAWWKVWLAILGVQFPWILFAAIGLLLLLFGGIGIFPLFLAAILFVIGLFISIKLFNQATQAGEV